MAREARVLFLCTGNSCRSQMAEGWVRRLHPGRITARSAGTAPGRVDPRAARVMAEADAPLDGQRSKHVDELRDEPFDLVVTVCGRADAACPTWPGAARRLHAPFDDPPRLAEGAADEAAALEPYRRVRDEIRAFVETLPARLAT